MGLSKVSGNTKSRKYAMWNKTPMWQNKNQSTINTLSGNQDQNWRKNSNLKKEKNFTLTTLNNESE